jgi:hypothetical protein
MVAMADETSQRTVEVRLSAATTPAQVRRICGRVHDIATVVAVEVDPGGGLLRVRGWMTAEEVGAAVTGETGRSSVSPPARRGAPAHPGAAPAGREAGRRPR